MSDLAPLLTAFPLLIIAAASNTDRFNPDAVAYLMLARHWQTGAWELAVSGYWGPLFPWLAVFAMPVSADLMAAGRAVMVISAMLFLGGGIALLRALQLPAEMRLAGGICLMAVAVAWSAHIMTPDLLVSGLLLLAAASMIGPRWQASIGRQLVAGLIFGVAYYAKGVALPLGLGLLLACAAWQALSGMGWREAALGAGRSLGVMLGVAAPWILVLSLHYGTPTFSTSGSVNLAIAGPAYNDGTTFAGHPAFSNFHAPREGRVTAWEEPTELPYTQWSPLSDLASMRHFLGVLRANATATIGTLRGFDAFGLGFAALLLAPLAAGAGLRPWQMAIVPVAMVGAVYLPSLSGGETRYFLPAYPFLVAAAAGVAGRLASGATRRLALARALAAGLVAVSFLVPLRHDVLIALGGRPNPALLSAREVAAAVQINGIPGGVASVGELGFAAIFTAFLLERPFMGTEATLPDVAALKELGAGILLVAPGGAADRALAADPLGRAGRIAHRPAGVAAWQLR